MARARDLSAGLRCDNYVGAVKVRNLFKGLPFQCELKNISINGQKRGCSGFITSTETGKICYITTEPFFDWKSGSGLWGDEKMAVMMRTAASLKDYTGGRNNWLPLTDIVEMAQRLTC